MTYRSIMIHMELNGSNDARIAIAADLARRFEANLIGVAAADPYPPAYGNSTIALELITQERHRIEKKMAEAETQFRTLLKAHEEQIEWRHAFEQPNDYVTSQSRAADLIITGPGHGGALIDPFHVMDTSELALEAGRPILIVPDGIQVLTAKRILVGWKDTREARIAVWDALPLLKAADCVTVCELIPGDNKGAAQARCDDVVRWLMRHGVSAAARVAKATASSKALEEIAAEETADLIVAGAYGHSRLSEWVWGGVTRTMLTAPRMCCLVAH